LKNERKREQAALTPGALNAHAAAQYLGFRDGRVMDELPIRRVDLAKPGALRPRWAWRVVDLDAFLASRVVEPGFPSPWSGDLPPRSGHQ